MSHPTDREQMESQDLKAIIKVKLTREGTEFEVKRRGNRTVMDIIRAVEMLPDGVLAFHGDTPLPLDDEICDLDEITIVNVASGG